MHIFKDNLTNFFKFSDNVVNDLFKLCFQNQGRSQDVAGEFACRKAR